MSRFTYLAASCYPRFGDPVTTAVILCRCPNVCACRGRQQVEGAAQLARECELEALQDITPEGEELPAVVAGQAFPYRPRDLFTAAELREHRRALMGGDVVWLSRS